MKIIRIENIYGCGPYHTENDEYDVELVEILYSHNDCSDHPNVFSHRMHTFDHYFGFTSFNQLVRWFPLHVIKMLKNNGFFIRILEVEDCDVEIFEHQCIFYMPDASYL